MKLSELSIADLTAIETHLTQQLPPMLSGDWERVQGPEGKAMDERDRMIRAKLQPRIDLVRGEFEKRLTHIFPED